MNEYHFMEMMNITKSYMEDVEKEFFSNTI